MLQDRMKLEQLAEEARHNKATEAVEAEKAAAQRSGVRQKYLDTAVRAAGGLAKLAGANDLNWYKSGIDHMEDAGNLSFVTYDAGQTAFVDGEQRLLKRSRASLAILKFDMMLGGSETSRIPPYYLAVYDLFNTIRAKNRGATNYSVNDLLTYLFAPSSWVVMFAQVERLCKIYNNPDMYAPITVQQIFSALGINYSSFQTDYNDIRSALEHAKKVCSQLAIPLTFNAVKRWAWLSSNCFIDSYSRPLKQIIVPYCENYHSIKTSAAAYATSVKHTNVFAPGVTSYATDIIGLLRDLEDEALAIIANPGFKAISGDILNAFGENAQGILNWTETFNDEADPFIYDEEFLVQYGNLALANLPDTVFNQLALQYDVDGNLGQGYHNSQGRLARRFLGKTGNGYTYPADSGGTMLRPVLKARLSNEEVFMATRMMYRPSEYSSTLAIYYYDPETDTYVSQTLAEASGFKYANLVEWGTELYEDLRFLSFNRNSQAPESVSRLDGSLKITSLTTLCAVNSFEVLPPIFATAFFDSNPDAQILFPGTDEYAVVSISNFSTINASALHGLWSAHKTVASSGKPEFKRKKPFKKPGRPTPSEDKTV